MSIGNQSYDFIDFILLVTPLPPDRYPLYTSQLINSWILELFFVFDNISQEVAEFE